MVRLSRIVAVSRVGLALVGGALVARAGPRRILSRTCTLLTFLPIAVGATEAAAQVYAMPHPDRFFTVEWEQHRTKRGPVVDGYLDNSYGANAERVLLLVEGLDVGGRVVSTTTGHVLGTVPSFGRAYFEVRVPSEAASYRVTVLSYEFVKGGG